MTGSGIVPALSFNVGLETISHRRVGEDAHLPRETGSPALFLPHSRELDKILNRLSLDERLASFLLPLQIDQELMDPEIMASTREATQALIERAALDLDGLAKATLSVMAAALEQDSELSKFVKSAHLAFCRG